MAEQGNSMAGVDIPDLARNVDAGSARLEKPAVKRILEKLAAKYPRPEAPLQARTPLETLVATILSAQTTDVQVNRITRRLFVRCRTPEDYVQLGVAGLEEYIRGCGLYRNKARNITAACEMLSRDFDGEVPKTREELMSLPGVGRKTANVVLTNAFDVPAFAVDTHVFRVANRLGLAASRNVLETEEQLTGVVPPSLWRDTHRRLIFHGRETCRARRPECGQCMLREECKNRS